MDELERYIIERHRALSALDMAWARRMAQLSPRSAGVTDEELLIGMHKARYNIPGLDRKLRLESAEWLRERGYSDQYGIPLLPPGQLPE